MGACRRPIRRSSTNGTLIGDAEPLYDQCSNASTPLNMDGTPGGVTASFPTDRNIGDLMNGAGITWGWFQGGFTPSSFVAGRAICGTQHANLAGALQNDYVEHHEPFQYYADTSNPNHVSPSSVNNVGISDPTGTPPTQAVNHQYDTSWFFKALQNGNMPQVSYLKPPAYQNGHAGNSDPLDEQKWLVDTINQIEESQFWPNTAIIIAYDDSDGWYDHQMGPIIRQSLDVNDNLNGPGKCGSITTPPAQNDRCGVGPRTPLLIISPWAKTNYVDNTFTEQASILRFIEDNWNLGRIGNQSADASAGTLMNAFDFNRHRTLAPAIIMNDNTGEIAQVIPTNMPKMDTVKKQIVSEGSSHLTVTKLPRVTLKETQSHGSLKVVVTTHGGSGVSTLVRARLFRGRRLVDNVATTVRDHHARFTLRLPQHSTSGRYTIRLSIDADGTVGAVTHRVLVRS